MTTKKLFTLCICLLAFSLAEAQIINKDKLKDKLNREKEKTKDKVKDKTRDTKNDLKRKGKNKANDLLEKNLDKMRGEYDSTSFSYSIALSDNAGSYEDSERGKRLMQFAISGTDFLEITKDSDRDYNQTAKNYTSLGSMFFASHKYKNAERFFNLAQGQFEKNNAINEASYAQVLANKGLLYETVGRYSEAEKFTTKALEIRKSTLGEGSNAYATSLNNLAMLYKDMGKYSEAESLMEQALAAIEKLHTQNSLPYAIALNNQAMIYQTLGRTDEAITRLQQVIKLAEPLIKEKSTTFQRFQANLALLLQEQKKYAEAERIYLEAIDSREKFLKIKQHPDVAHLKVLLASLYVEMGKAQESEKLLLEAKDAYEGKLGKQSLGYATTLSYLGNLYKSQDRVSDAEPLLKECLTIRQTFLSDKHPLYTKAQEDLALLYWLKQEYTQASELYRNVILQSNDFIQKYFPAMSEREKEKYLSKLRPTHQRFFNFVIASQEKTNLATEMYELHLATKAILLSSSSKIKQKILSSGNTDLINDYKTWVDLKEDMSLLYMMTQAERIKLEQVEFGSHLLFQQQLHSMHNHSMELVEVHLFLLLQRWLDCQLCLLDLIQQLKSGLLT